MKSVVLIGSGPGIGLSVASKFAQNGYNVALLSRNAERLKSDEAAVLGHAKENASVKTWAVDVTVAQDLERTLQSIDSDPAFSTIECVYFNCARVGLSMFFDFNVEELQNDFQTTNVALYTTAKWAIPKLQALAKSSPELSPSLLVTNSMLYKDPIPPLFSLCLTKSAQRSLVHSLAKTFEPEGIHVALVSVEGQVSPDKPNMNPTLIAEKAWELFTQDKGKWTLEIEILEK